MVRIGVDTGGTFTDVCLIDGSGATRVFKLSSSPDDPSNAIGAGILSILDRSGYSPADVRFVGHGTTVATNSLLEGRGAKTGVITTDGFRDLLDLGRQMRPSLYDLQVEKPRLLVRRYLRHEVPERILATGEVHVPLDVEAVRAAARRLAEDGVEAVAVCFLFSYLAPEHEDLAGAILAEELPEAYISLSHDVLAEFREYERLSTTVINSFVGPVMSRYTRRLKDRLAGAGIPVAPFITQSNGGIISLDVAAATPVRTILSGPAAGVVGATTVSLAAGFPDIITFDMGGTSTDVALISGGMAGLKMEQTVAGYPIRTPMLDINTVGAGGGSIAWIDGGGHLKVGPQSAGAVPGPSAYGNGGHEATVTDANVALGILSRKTLLGGEMTVDAGSADSAVDRVAGRLGLTREEVAEGIIGLATVNMARAIRVISVERGYDPRDYALVAFGGAGPLHAGRLARELEIPTILVPAIPGILCAFGLLAANMRTDFSRTLVVPAAVESLETINAGLQELRELAEAWFEQEAIASDDRAVQPVADMRYVGQNYELSVPLSSTSLDDESLAEALEAFHLAHDQSYGYSAPTEPVQIVTLRMEATGLVPPPALPLVATDGTLEEARIENRTTWLSESGGWTDVPVYDRGRLSAGLRFTGPAIVEQMDSTTLILPGQEVEIDQYGNLIIREMEKGGER